MEPIGNHGLACLDDTDYADYARYMQCQAEIIDALLADQLELLTGALERPTIITRPNAAGDRVIASGVTISNFYNEVLFNNSSFMGIRTDGSNVFIDIGSPVGGGLNPYLPGMYMVGAVTAMDATGAVTAFSQRRLTVNAVDDTLAPGSSQVGLAFDVNPDSNTTITQISCNAAFTMVLRGTNGVRVGHAITHTNAASTVTVQGFNSFLWVTYIGPNELVGVS